MPTQKAILTPDCLLDLPALPYRLQTRSGRAFAETMFGLGMNRARIPDVAWVTNERLGQISRENRVIAIAPDLAIEILSNSEQPDQMERKLRDYLEAGVEVWQIFPSTSSVTTWRDDTGIRLAGDQIVSSQRLPGFSVRVSDFFRE